MTKRKRAIVIGGGVAGKLAARVLADFFHEVMVLEQSLKPNGPEPRKGTTQDRHFHTLLHAGENGLEKLFPGITRMFHENGAVAINSTRDFAWFHHGVWKLRYEDRFRTTLQTRPHLEWQIEQYIKKVPNISFFYNQAVLEHVLDPEKNQLKGVKVQDVDGSVNIINADMVVDTTGAGSFSSRWMKKRGISIPEERVEIGLCYASRLYRLPERSDRDWKIKMLYPDPPEEKIGGTVSKVEGDRYIVMLLGYHDAIHTKEVIKNEEAFLDLARQLPEADIYEEIKQGTPLTETSVYRVPEMVWRRFDRVELPDGLLLMGDAVARVDPVFGQGMSIAVLQALELQKILQDKKMISTESLTPIFQKKIAKIIAPVWEMVRAEDFRYPETQGKRSFSFSIRQWYARQIFLLSAQNRFVYRTFVKVMNMVQPTTMLFHPKILKAVAVHALWKK